MAAEIAAQEAAAAAVEEEAEDEDDEEADALDEDADSARYDPEFRHPLSELPDAASDVSVGHAFVSGLSSHVSPAASKSADGEETRRSLVTLGEPIKTIVAFSNEGRVPYHVWGVMGSLNRDDKFHIYVQNFSYYIVNKTVQPSEELSFAYTFTPNARLDIRPFQLAVTMFYEARGSSGNAIRGHSTTFYNSTVDTQPGPQTMSNSMFMLFFFAAVAAAVGGWYTWKNFEAQQAQQQKETVEMGTTDSSKNEWLEDHNMVKTGGGRAAKRKTSKQQ